VVDVMGRDVVLHPVPRQEDEVAAVEDRDHPRALAPARPVSVAARPRHLDLLPLAPGEDRQPAEVVVAAG
jgi:hypothetical protein